MVGSRSTFGIKIPNPNKYSQFQPVKGVLLFFSFFNLDDYHHQNLVAEEFSNEYPYIKGADQELTPNLHKEFH